MSAIGPLLPIIVGLIVMGAMLAVAHFSASRLISERVLADEQASKAAETAEPTLPGFKTLWLGKRNMPREMRMAAPQQPKERA